MNVKIFKKILNFIFAILLLLLFIGCDLLLNRELFNRELFNNELSNEVVEPFITTNWAQSGGYYPDFTYNNQTPLVSEKERALAGCTPVAFGQVLKYYNYPKKGFSSNKYCSTGASVYNCWDGEIIEASFNTKYEWEQMSDSLNYYSTPESIDAVSKLLFHLGVSLNIKYGEHGSSAQIEKPTVFNNLKKYFRMPGIQIVKRYEKSEKQWEEIIKNEILAKRPVVLSGSDSSVNAGHAYILDGRNEEGQYHVNWGWGGSANGYYDLNTLVIDGMYSFTEGLVAFINLTPNVVEENGTCNGPEGSRCVDGLECMKNNQILNEFESDEYGVCTNKDNLDNGDEDDGVVLETIQNTFTDTVAKGQWKHLGPFHSKENFRADMTGDGDADLYVGKGSQPTKDDYDCRPYKAGSNESCSLEGEGDFYISISGYADSSNFDIKVTYKVEK